MLNSTNTIKNAGFKSTPGRRKILALFEKKCKPLSAEEVFNKTKVSGLNLATIYRTLQSFEETGILKRVDLRKDSIYYELKDKHHHHHLVCKDCGDVEDFDATGEVSIFTKALKGSKKFAKVTDHSLELFGICLLCSKK